MIVFVLGVLCGVAATVFYAACVASGADDMRSGR